MALYEDFLQVIIDGVDLSDFVTNYQRNESICEPGQIFSLGFTRKKFDGSILDIGVSKSVEIKEKYPTADRVLKGYVTQVSADANDANLRVQGGDKYVLLTDYFIDQRFETQGESVAYWIQRICALVGLSVQFDTYPGIATDGGDGNGGTPLGMQTAVEAITTLERKGAIYTRYDSDLDKIVVYTLKDSEPKVSINSSNLIVFDRQLGTELTRNKVIVWGGADYNWLTNTPKTYNAVARANIPELITDKTVVFSSPEIRSITFASIVARRILASTASLDDIVVAECAGLYPNVKITNVASISISQGETDYGADRMITSISVAVSKGQGAKTSFTFGEKCPRITISPPPFYVYATYVGPSGGAAVSYDAGDSFRTFNTGLPPAGIPAISIAANAYNRLMMISPSGVYRRPGIYGTWSKVTTIDTTPPSPDDGQINYPAGSMIWKKVEKETNLYGTFHVLGRISEAVVPSGQQRWWTYFTRDFGNTWDSMEMYTPGSGFAIGTTSGLPINLITGPGITRQQVRDLTLQSGVINWNVFAHDIEGNETGNVTVLLSGGEPFAGPPDTTAGDSFWYTRVFKQTSFPNSCLVDIGILWGDAAPTKIAFRTYPTSGYILQDRKNDSFGSQFTVAGTSFTPVTFGVNSTISIPNDRKMVYHFIGVEFGVAGGEFRLQRATPTLGGLGQLYWWPFYSAFLDVPVPEVVSMPFHLYENGSDSTPRSVLVDYSSRGAESETKSRWAAVYVNHPDVLGLWSPGGGCSSWVDDRAGGYLEIKAFFFEDDTSKPAATSLTVEEKKAYVADSLWWESPGGGRADFGVDLDYSWNAVGIVNQTSTTRESPRALVSGSPPPGGANDPAVTHNLNGINYGYYATFLHTRASDDGTQWDPVCGAYIARDIDEADFGYIVIIKLNLTDKIISSVTAWPLYGYNEAVNPIDYCSILTVDPIGGSIVVELRDQNEKVTIIKDGTLVLSESFTDYQHILGVRHVPFWVPESTAFGFSPKHTAPQDLKILYDSFYTTSNQDPPPPPSPDSSVLYFGARCQPTNGYYILGRRTYPSSGVYIYKSERSDIGLQLPFSGIGFVGSNFQIGAWDFRTKSGGGSWPTQFYEQGGQWYPIFASGDWNNLSYMQEQGFGF
jgi:hypothetical protein